MPDPSDPYDSLYEQVRNCTKCHSHPEIKTLLPEGFKYRWEPWRKGEPPYRFIFVAMEPNSKYEIGEVYPQPGSFNEPLRFAIDHFLFKPGQPLRYLITNMAKRSLALGPVCNNTQAYRYENCAPFLASEIANAGSTYCIVSIGKDPKTFLETNRGWYGPGVQEKHIHRVDHYAAKNTPRFKEFAIAHTPEYEHFRDEHFPEFEEFLRVEARPRADSFKKAPDNDMWRIFKYFFDFRAILECEVCHSNAGNVTSQI